MHPTLRGPSALLALSALLLAAPASAHGEGVKTIAITEQGCVLSAPPCLVPDSGTGIEAGATTVVAFENELDTAQEVMVHLDQGGPGSLLADMRTVEPGQTVELSVEVPADASGVWYMASAGGEETARLFGEAQADQHHAGGEESPGPGVALLLGLVALAALLRRS